MGSELKNLQQMQMVNSHLQVPGTSSFSHTLKHPYITVAADGSSALKNSHAGGYKLAIMSSSHFPLSEQMDPSEIEARVKITKSCGNILVGIGVPEVIKER